MDEIHHIRNRVINEGKSLRSVCRETGRNFRTVKKYVDMEDFNEYPRKRKPKRSVLDPYKPVIDEWLSKDLTAPRKQRHTATRVYNRLRELYPDFSVSMRTVQYYVAKKKKELFKAKNEVYLPLTHPAGEAQVDFGQAVFKEKGQEITGHYLVVTFPHSNASFVQLFRSENLECLLEGLKNIFEYVGGVPTKLWFDNLTPVVKTIFKDGERGLTEGFKRFRMHYGFQCTFCNPNSGHEKGSVENKVGYHRRNFFVPVPEFQDMEEYNRQLLAKSSSDMQRKHYREQKPIAQLFEEEKQHLLPLPSQELEVFKLQKVRTDKCGRARWETNLYSTAPQLAQKEVWLKITHDQVIVMDENYKTVVVHKRLYGRHQESTVWEPYIPTIASRPNALGYTGFYKLLPTPWKEYLTSCTRGQRKQALVLLHKMICQSSLELATEALVHTLRKGVKDLDSIEATYHRLLSPLRGSVNGKTPLTTRAPAQPRLQPNLRQYDKLLKGS